MPNLLIAASGTGGHIFPALAIAQSLPKSWRVIWLGVPDRLENTIVPSKYNLRTITLSGLQGNLIQKFFQLIKSIFAINKISHIIKKEKIELIFTTGGYIAAPTILAARLCKIKVVLHESNAFPGRVTRILGNLCNKVLIGLPPAEKFLKGSDIIFTGIPIRNSFLVKPNYPIWLPLGSGPLVAIFGGSQGAIGLNYMVKDLIPFLLNKGCRIVHLTGANYDNRAEINSPNLVVKEFSDDIPGLLYHTDLAICRAGAGTISELAITKTPAIFVPFPYASDNHQFINAQYVAMNGGGLIFHQRDYSSNRLKDIVVNLLGLENQDRTNLISMKKYIGKLGVKNSSELIVNILFNYLQ